MLNWYRLANIGQELVGRVRDDDPQANRRWLHALTTAEERDALVYVLAAMVPADKSLSALLGWVHGTPWAAARHEERGAKMCALCMEWANEPLSTDMSTRETAA